MHAAIKRIGTTEVIVRATSKINSDLTFAAIEYRGVQMETGSPPATKPGPKDSASIDSMESSLIAV